MGNRLIVLKRYGSCEILLLFEAHVLGLVVEYKRLGGVTLVTLQPTYTGHNSEVF